MTARTPQPGEWWWTNLRGGLAQLTEKGWAWPGGELIDPAVSVSPVGVVPVAYSAAVVDKLRAEVSSERVLTRSYLAQTESVLNQCDALRVERDAAHARAEDFEAELDAERQKVRFPGLADIARDEPWRVLRAAASAYERENGLPDDSTNGVAAILRMVAQDLEREHAEKSRRDRLIDVAMDAADGLHNRVAFGAVVDAVLAEAGDVQ